MPLTFFFNVPSLSTHLHLSFHEMDPLVFSDGFRLQWRNGDMNDPHSGLKCFTETGGNVVGSPTATDVISYAWVYVWN